eukprot:m.129165 g.129165  ORF g.129165 m.129165 type:complete len:441 (+) comp9459_c1_seq4:7887-9209(+)
MDELLGKIEELVIANESRSWDGDRVAKRTQELLQEHAKVTQDESISNALKLYSQAKILSVKEPLDPNCEKLLSKAVKLSPDDINVWNLLGEICWRKGDLEEAKSCFESALGKRENVQSYQHMSMLLRQLSAKSPVERLKLVDESIAVARKAIKLDSSNGHSWFVLGNAYMTMFFGFTRFEGHLNQAVAAFEQATRDEKENSENPDLHFNRGTLFRYTENFDRALEAFRLASKIDPQLEVAQHLREAVCMQLKNTFDNIANKGELKQKKIDGHVESLCALDKEGLSCGLSILVDGVNEGKWLLAKVVLVLTRDPMPQVLLVVDKEGTFECLTVYNTKDNAIKLGDVVRIQDPTRHDVKIEDDEDIGSLSFPSIRVENPKMVERNGKMLGMSNNLLPKNQKFNLPVLLLSTIIDPFIFPFPEYMNTGDRNIVMSQLAVQNKS